ncbi:MAG TPA: hypothetical protein V6C97_03025 [Oculatellaceae cyanobacterium]
MDRERQSTAPRPQKTRLLVTDWVFLRKFETAVFAFMFMALPFFALKVVYTTTSSMAIKNSVVDLVRDLISWQKNAREKHIDVKIESKVAEPGQPSMYVVTQDGRTLEEVRLPAGVTIVGSVTFTAEGAPAAPGSFIITKGIRSATVDIDKQGLVRAP